MAYLRISKSFNAHVKVPDIEVHPPAQTSHIHEEKFVFLSAEPRMSQLVRDVFEWQGALMGAGGLLIFA